MRADVLQRQARVTAVSRDAVTLQLLGSACAGCGDGCGGRCNLLASERDARIELPREPGMELMPGQAVLLTFSDRALRNAAFAGYGRALLGMLLGAGIGQWLAWGIGLPADPPTLVGLLLGVLWAARRTGDVRVNPALTTTTAHSVSSSLS